METTNQSRHAPDSLGKEVAIAFVAGKDTMDVHDVIPFSVQQSEHWLLERTYHARLKNGEDLSVPDLTLAMTQLIDFFVPLSSQSAKSRLPERLPLKKSRNFSAPLPTWREISQEAASVLYEQGSPILLYNEHAWEHPPRDAQPWRPNKHMRAIIFENVEEQEEAVSGTEYAVCYLDLKRGTFSNAAWRAWFSTETATIFDTGSHRAITFLAPCVQFPYTTHYTVVASGGQIHEYAEGAEAIQGFQTFSSQEMDKESNLHSPFPQFCYYQEVTCPGGIYRLELFGSGMNKPGYAVKGMFDSGAKDA